MAPAVESLDDLVPQDGAEASLHRVRVHDENSHKAARVRSTLLRKERRFSGIDPSTLYIATHFERVEGLQTNRKVRTSMRRPASLKNLLYHHDDP